ncbi:DUF5695 domain-containing protein [Novosphingobium sp. 9]|uniref:DUF5695 domain-containing protein n=1 Tax=Novosphingobium sp. 9 TaxID=2025349 RepID=UPI0021B5528C|nr:DUF5695 domain-containing protein [Novosphingobium sp. 9]
MRHSFRPSRKSALAALLLASVAMTTLTLPVDPAPAQEPAERPKPVYPPIRTAPYSAGPFAIALRADTGTLAKLSPQSDPGFDFTPSGRNAERQYDGYVQLGDINLRLRVPGGEWQDFSSSHKRRQIASLPAKGEVIAAYDVTPSMTSGTAGATIPLSVHREWLRTANGLALRFVLTNTSAQAVEIGGLGMPMVFDNIINDRTLDQAHAEASFVDPYIGRDAGYLQVTRLNGKGPALLVIPEKGTPLEAYRPIQMPRQDDNIFTDRTQRGQTFEGFYDWTVASKGFAEKEWKNAGQQWNTPTSMTLKPGESRTVGVRFVESPGIEAIEDTLRANHRPVAIGVPGYVVPKDLPATLFLDAARKVKSIDSFPEGALQATEGKGVKGWNRYEITGKTWGQARLNVTYDDGEVQTVSYFVTKPLEQVNADLGHFTTTQQWFEGAGDPFHRTPAILTYDREKKAIVTQEPRVWISGMSDEGGAGSWVAAMMKQLDNPDPVEVKKLETLVDKTVEGVLQVPDGPHAGAVKKSIFYYDPKELPDYYDKDTDWRSWTSWSKKDAGDLGRAYNYPHVAIGHWVLYRLARDHTGLVTAHDWHWYLEHAYITTTAMMRDAPYYAQFGLMEGNVFVSILDDLKREGMTEEAANMERLMKERADQWAKEKYPFGSEMAWDSTGQPEVYAWMRYFDHIPQADETRDVILAYDPTIPSWGYNGNARRYWDFLYGGKVARIERQIHHYGSALNAVPLFEAYRAKPTDLHLLRAAYGGFMGGITNIDQQGFGSAAFHSWPDMMKWDAYTGDYGMGYYGHAYAAATYLVDDPRFGWLGFGGIVSQQGKVIHIEPHDGARSRLFVAPAGLWITLDAGKIRSADYDSTTGAVTLTLDAADADTPSALFRVEQTVTGGKAYSPSSGTAQRGGWALPLGASVTRVVLSPN